MRDPEIQRWWAKASRILGNPTPALPDDEVRDLIAPHLARADDFLNAAARHGSPLYVLEPDILRARARHFVTAFTDVLPDVAVYYAVKSNNCPDLARILLEGGLGLDVSSGKELETALSMGAADILFSGPGKTDAELSLVVAHADRVKVMMDSFAELRRLQRLAQDAERRVRAGIRLTTEPTGLWRKFGIPLGSLRGFFAEAATCPNVVLEGLQAHTSWNLDATRPVGFIRRLGQALATLDGAQRARLGFLDLGGGFWPPRGEWLLPAGTPAGALRKALCPETFEEAGRYRLPAAPIEQFASQLAEAVERHIFPRVRCRICFEPGRWLVHDCMHLLMTVVDRKADDLVITDAGTNAIGWERFEVDYFPVVNLTRPSLEEKRCDVLGCLCTPHDVWGRTYHGQDIRPGDVLLVPEQGAYTYSLRQDFIKPLPKVVSIDLATREARSESERTTGDGSLVPGARHPQDGSALRAVAEPG